MSADPGAPSPDASELEALRRRVAELERERGELEQRYEDLVEQSSRFRRFFEHATETIAILDRGVVVEVNPRVKEMFGYEVEEAIGLGALEFIAPESRDLVAENIRSGTEAPYEAMALRKDGTTFVGEFRGKPISYEGRRARITMVHDITARKRGAEALRDAAVREGVIRAQARMLDALSTPLLPIGEEVMLLPLIGEMTAERGRQVLETLVEGVAARGASIALLDVTGVPVVDAPVAELLLRAARAVRLLGAEVALTGVRPEVARTLVEIGVELGCITTYGSLEQGVARALGRRRAARERGG